MISSNTHDGKIVKTIQANTGKVREIDLDIPLSEIIMSEFQVILARIEAVPWESIKFCKYNE